MLGHTHSPECGRWHTRLSEYSVLPSKMESMRPLTTATALKHSTACGGTAGAVAPGGSAAGGAGEGEGSAVEGEVIVLV